MKKIISLLLCAVLLSFAFTENSPPVRSAFTGADMINIVIDPGHGGSSVGTAARGVGEKEFTYKLALLLADELEANGSFTVQLTRVGDYDLELFERAEIANNYNADMLISLHFDGNPSSSLNGVTCFTSVLDKYAAVSLSNSICKKLSEATGLKNNGVVRRKDTEGYYWNEEKQWDCKDSSLGVLSDYYGIPTWCAKFGIPSIIVEHGYMTNAGDCDIIFGDGALEKMAKAEAEAIISYYTGHTHVYSQKGVDYASNCVYTGKSSEKCSVCGHRRNVELLADAPNNHYWVTTERNAASCGVDGSIVRECRITESLKKKGWPGEMHRYVEVLPAPTEHTFELVDERAVTHTEDGYKEWSCKTCSYSFKDVYKAEGHSYELISSAEPTCTEDGHKTYKCPVCSHEYSETFSALGHDLPEDSTVTATCTSDGTIEGECKRCGKVIKELLPKLGHDMETSEVKAANCIEDGERLCKCARCGFTEKETVPAAGHNFEKTKELEPLCEKEGRNVFVCEACGEKTTEKLPPLGHEKGKDGEIITEAGLFSKGEIRYVCKNGCGKIYTEKLPSAFDEDPIPFVLGGAAIAVIAGGAVLLLILVRKRRKNKAPTEATEEKESPQDSEAKADADNPGEEVSVASPADTDTADTENE